MPIDGPSNPTSPAGVLSPAGIYDTYWGDFVNHSDTKINLLLNDIKHGSKSYNFHDYVPYFDFLKHPRKRLSYDYIRNAPLIYAKQDYHWHTIKVTKPRADNNPRFSSVWVTDEGAPISTSTEIKVELSVFLNTQNGEVNFKNIQTSYCFNAFEELECKLYFTYAKINNQDARIANIPAVVFCCYQLAEFTALLESLDVDMVRERSKLFAAIKSYFVVLAKSNNNLKTSRFYNSLPANIMVMLRTEVSNAQAIFQKHFIQLVSSTFVENQTENAILKLMQHMVELPDPYKTKANLSFGPDWFLQYITKTYASNSPLLLFHKLYRDMNDTGIGGNNFTRLNNLLYQIWLHSSYKNGEHPDINVFTPYYNPSVISYANNRILGFNKNSTYVDFSQKVTNGLEVKQKIRRINSYGVNNPAGYAIETLFNSPTNIFSNDVEIFNATYHLFHPVSVIKITEDGDVISSEIKTGKLEIRTPMPAFYFKALNDQLDWQNLSTAGWLALDVATTFSGVGNALKFRHLTKVARGVRAATTAAEAAKAASVVYRAVKIGAGVVEITSGTVNALLKLSELDNTQWGKNVSNILAVLEVLSLAGEITAGMKAALKKNADELLKHEDEIFKTAKKADEVKQLDEMFDTISQLTEQEAKRGTKQFGKITYQMLNPNLLKKYIDDAIAKCKSKGVTLEFKWVDSKHPRYFETDFLGSFKITENPKKVILNLRPECPKMTWFHEQRHIDDFLEMGWKRYSDISKTTPWIHEQSVWNHLYKNRNKWSDAELVDAYLYVKRYTWRTSNYKIEFFVKEMQDLGNKLGLIKK